jgi:hypothetical protein
MNMSTADNPVQRLFLDLNAFFASEMRWICENGGMLDFHKAADTTMTGLPQDRIFLLLARHPLWGDRRR